jgi:RimJ/RimL family protein N-acetyltransferase
VTEDRGPGGDASPCISGETIYLRELTTDDVSERYCAWLNDPDVNRYLETRFQPQTRERVLAYVAEQRASGTAVLLGIRRKADDCHLGNLRIGAIDRHHATATMALFIGEKDAWGRGYGTEAIRLATRYALGTLGLRKLTARCYATNFASIRAFERAGWVNEGRQRSQFISEGKVIDGVWLGFARAADGVA